MPQLAATPLKQTQLDPQLTLDCAAASLAAYADFDRTTVVIPKGYQCVARFTGWDAYFFAHDVEERFGLVLQSLTAPGTYIIAFRGTDSLLDVYEDLWTNAATFMPFDRGAQFPANVEVAAGFYSIYSDMGGAMQRSMQAQVFAELDALPVKPTRLIVTGHSLGGALANLFALDVAVSRPGPEVVNMTFASPRTGGSHFKQAFSQAVGAHGSSTRVANYWDWVPTMPPEVFGYHHVGERFLVAFYVQGEYIAHPLSRHSLENYQVVLEHAMKASPQVWVGTFPDHAYSGRLMASMAPNNANVPEWAALHHKQELEAAGPAAERSVAPIARVQ